MRRLTERHQQQYWLLRLISADLRFPSDYSTLTNMVLHFIDYLLLHQCGMGALSVPAPLPP